MGPDEYLRLVLDPVRLAVLGRAATGPVNPAALATALGIPARTVLAAVGRLQGAGLLTKELMLDRDRLIEVATNQARRTPHPEVLDGPWSPQEVEVMSRFFDGGRLVQIPANRSKRIVVLERIAHEFEPGFRYEERRVNLMLRPFYADYATLRRYLVDEGFLSRENGEYWRSGGRV